MSAPWCREVVEDAIKKHGKPEIHNSDQGSQFTSEEFIALLKKNEIKISMDGKRRALDNIYIERFWRSIKQEKIYLNPPMEVLSYTITLETTFSFTTTKEDIQK